MSPHLQPCKSIQSLESTSAYAVTNVVVLRRIVIDSKEAQRMDEMMAGPAKTCMKQHSPKAVPKMGITTAMIHHVTMDLPIT